MIIDRVVLHNFGIYKDRHTIDLTPEDGKPIVLFGGLNGGGKTTFLDAILLALYGKFAPCSNRANLSYDDFLIASINQGASKNEGASVRLDFQQWQRGEKEEFSVTRAWRLRRKSVHETVDVCRNGVTDPESADRWYEVVEEIVPSRIAKLFFFDGEKIEDLASRENSASLISTGLNTLLGLDLVSTLQTDLAVLRRRKATASKGESEKSKYQSIADEVDTLEERIGGLTRKRGALTTQHDDLIRQGSKLRDQYRRMGGELYDQRESLQAEHETIARSLAQVEARLREVAAGAAPLLLIVDQLKVAEQASKTDFDARSSSDILKILQERDNALLEYLSDLPESPGVKSQITDFLKSDRKRLEKKASNFCDLGIDPSVFMTLDDGQLAESAEQSEVLLEEYASLQQSLAMTERKIAGIPDPEGLEGISEEIARNEQARLRYEHQRQLLTDEISQLSVSLKQARLRRTHAEEHLIHADYANEKVQRTISTIGKVSEILTKFRARLTSQHTGTLAGLILDSYRSLVRKDDLIAKINIDSITNELSLIRPNGEPISPARLSAGERQLLVVAILWGLMKASGKPLPTVIDTPLGRLDGTHRSNLVENYFPSASHQVILLSTDKEIDEDFYSSLLPYITHDYRLYYDEERQSSRVIDGYFWKGAA